MRLSPICLAAVMAASLAWPVLAASPPDQGRPQTQTTQPKKKPPKQDSEHQEAGSVTVIRGRLVAPAVVSKVVDPDPLGLGHNMTFTITVTCANPAGSGSVNVAGGASVGPVNLPAGGGCQVSERAPRLPDNCSWLHTDLPAYIPHPAVVGHLTVTNGYRCQKPGTVTVTKLLREDPRHIGHDTAFHLTLTCTNPTATYHLTVAGYASAAVAVPAGSHCSIAEDQPSPPLPLGCTWVAPVFAPQQGTIQSGLNPVKVTNSYRCLPLPVR